MGAIMNCDRTRSSKKRRSQDCAFEILIQFETIIIMIHTKFKVARAL